MARKIIYFTNKPKLTAINFTEKLAPEINPYCSYVTPELDVIYLVNDHMGIDDFEKWWASHIKPGDLFCYVWHSNMEEILVEYCESKSPFAHRKGMHQNSNTDVKYYKSIQPIVEAFGSNPGLEFNDPAKFTQEQFNTIWSRDFSDPKNLSKSLYLLKQIFSGRQFTEIPFSDILESDFNAFREELNGAEAFDITNAAHIAAFEKLRSHLLDNK